MQSAEVLEVDGHCREVARRLLASIEVLVLRPERHHECAAFLPVVTDPVDDAESRALHDVDGLLAVLVLARMAPGADLGDQTLGAPPPTAHLAGAEPSNFVVLN